MLMRLHLCWPNAVANEDTLFQKHCRRHKYFPSLSSMANIVATQKMFLINIIFLQGHGCVRNNASATCCTVEKPSLNWCCCCCCSCSFQSLWDRAILLLACHCLPGNRLKNTESQINIKINKQQFYCCPGWLRHVNGQWRDTNIKFSTWQ